MRPVVQSPVRSQPQEAYSYPPPYAGTARPMALRRQTSELKAKAVPPQPVPEPVEISTSRGLPDTPAAPVVPTPPSGLKMKLKLGWMALKSKAKL